MKPRAPKAARRPTDTAPRSPTDGLPFYCNFCRLGFAEYMACEELDCDLETDEQAKARQAAAGIG